MLKAASHYAANGFPVFPCRATNDKSNGSKAPHLPGESAPGKHDGGHWLASVDTDNIAAWWRRWPNALIGFPTGRRTKTVVIDLDPREAQVADMLGALRDFIGGDLKAPDPETGELLRPAVAWTQSGGLHLYYAYPSDVALQALGREKIENRADLFRAFVAHGEAPKLLSHIDVRGEGGYVIAPPSQMENGARYSWEIKPVMAEYGRFALPPLPKVLCDVICGRRQPRAVVEENRNREARARRFSARGVNDARVRKYVEASIAGALADARNAGAGVRNEAVYLAARRLASFVRGGFLGRDEAEQLLLSNLPAGVSPGEKKVKGTIKSGLDNSDISAFSPDKLGERAA